MERPSAASGGASARIGALRSTARRVAGEDARAAVVLLVALTAIAAALRIVVATQDLFADELATYWIVSTRGLGDVVTTVDSTAEISPPLSFVLSWLAARVGFAPEVLRSPALIGGIASVPLVYLIGLRTLDRRAALLAATLTTFSPFMIYYGTEARGYGLMMALVLGSTLSLLLAADGGRRRWWAAYALCTCAAAYTHYTCVFVLGAQLLWVMRAYPRARRGAVVASGVAALGFLPWIPSLRADLDSPTTEILAALSPFNLETVWLSLQHWSLGYPYSSFSELTDLPGTFALILLAVSVAAGAHGLVAHGWLGGSRGRGGPRIPLVLILALATPVGEALVSLAGSDLFGTRNLAASWPYAALALAGLVISSKPPLRLPAVALAVIAFAIAGVKMLETRYERPNYDEVASFIEGGSAEVVVDAAARTPGPLTNFDVSLDPNLELFRLGISEQRGTPFTVFSEAAEPFVVARDAAAAAGGGPIVVVATGERDTIAGQANSEALVTAFARSLPPRYRLTSQRAFPGAFELKTLLFERRALATGG